MDSICIVHNDVVQYPKKETIFRPSVDYPEYIFHGEISKENNLIYNMVREGFSLLNLDAENKETKEWNPLGKFIKPGDYVLIKPNMVLHENKSGCGVDCLYTNPSIVAAMIDYILIALKGEGKIIVGDASLQECDFKTLINQSGYDSLIDYYKKKKVDIQLVDFRNVKTYEKDGLHYLQEEKGENGIIVKLDNKSAFANLSREKINNLRITNYDPRILQKHHDEKVHEYNITKYVLDADVIINIPKPKTHRKAGVTISLKNLIGINTNKEFLPHHTLGSKREGGDAYLQSNELLDIANKILDIKNELIYEKEMSLASEAEKFYSEVFAQGMAKSKEKYWEGSWYGNDTIWRTILDLNRILMYADKSGKITNQIQRKLFIVGDMIISGEKEGPLEPTPLYPGVIVMGDDPLKFDRVVCSLMGFDYHDIPTLYNNELLGDFYSISKCNEVKILSNDELWNKKSMDEIREKYSLEFQPTLGWVTKLGNKYRENLYKRLCENGSSVYIFGAGANGIYAKEELLSHGIKVEAFCDNNLALWGTEIIDNIFCVSFNELDKNKPFIIATGDRAVREIAKQINAFNGKVWGVINTIFL